MNGDAVFDVIPFKGALFSLGGGSINIENVDNLKLIKCNRLSIFSSEIIHVCPSMCGSWLDVKLLFSDGTLIVV